MLELNVLLLRKKKIHWGGKQAEALVIACRVLELLQVLLGKTNSENRYPSDLSEPRLHFLAQDFSHILHVLLVGVLLFTPHSRSLLCTTKI